MTSIESFETRICTRLTELVGACSGDGESAGRDGESTDANFFDGLRIEIAEKHGSIENYLEYVLDRYIQCNYLGPVPSEVASSTDNNNVESDEDKTFISYLESVCSEPVFTKASNLRCLAICQYVVDNLLEELRPSYCLYAARLIYLLQDLLEDKAPSLHGRLMRIVENETAIRDTETDPSAASEQAEERKIEHQLLLAQLCLTYFESKQANRLLADCQTRLGLSASLCGAAGIRTRFQQQSHAQLYLSITSTSSSSSSKRSSTTTDNEQSLLPKDVAPTDDTLLANVKFTDSSAVEAEAATRALNNLTAIEQACLLLAADCHRRSRASDGIVEEELLAYANALLLRPMSWCVATAALLRRSRIELGLLGGAGGSGGGSTRRLERALQQLEELSAQLTKPQPTFSPHRRRLFFACSLPPAWQLQVGTADALMAVGAISSALDIYLRWDHYSQIIACYQRLEKPALAENIIRQRLAETETPELYCALAEVTRDWNHLHMAWRLSKGRCARAARSLGYIAMVNGQYTEAMHQFELSLGANHLQPKAWFTYGCCCLQAGEPDKAEQAFRRSAQLEPDNYEAWTNLGTAMVKRGNKIGACAALREALKSNWEQWRVWDNYLAVCADTGQFGEAVRAYHRLVELRPKYWDPHSASVLVRAATQEKGLVEDRSARLQLQRQLLTLFARVAAQTSADAEFWWLYARLLSMEDEAVDGDNDPADHRASLTPEAKTRVLQTLQKCHRCDTQQSDWFRESAQRRDRVLSRAADIAQRYVDYAGDCPQSLLSARLMLTGLLARKLEDGPPFPPPSNELMLRLKSQLELINDLMKAS